MIIQIQNFEFFLLYKLCISQIHLNDKISLNINVFKQNVDVNQLTHMFDSSFADLNL